jgi:hypothetical protein
VTAAEQFALDLLRWLISKQGAEMVGAALTALTGGSGMLIEDLSVAVGAVLRVILETLPAERVKAEIDGLWAAADADIAAAEDAKFGKP